MSKEEISEEVQEKIGQLQMLEKNMQNFMMQKQMNQAQLAEIDSALEELKDSSDAYKIVGNIMIAAKTPELEKELKEKKTLLKKRVDTVESQEKKLKEKAEEMHGELMKTFKSD